MNEATKVYMHKDIEVHYIFKNTNNDELFNILILLCIRYGIVNRIEDFICILVNLGIKAKINKVKYYTVKDFVRVKIKIYGNSYIG